MKLNVLPNVILMIGSSILPVYLWSSGGVQIAHAILFVGALFVLLRSDLRLSAAEALLAALTATVFVRESFAVMEGANSRVLVFPLYVVFNFVLFLSLVRWFRIPNAVNFFVIGVIVAVAIAIGGVLIIGYGANVYSYERAVGTFNNPNQLGYFAVCVFSISFFLYLNGWMRFSVLFGLVLSSLLLAVLSLSKASMISVFVPMLAVGFALARNKGVFIVGPLIALAVILGTYHLVTSTAIDDMTFVQRLSTLGSDSDDSFEARGYMVILEADTLELLVGFGAEETSRVFGEGNDVNKMHEIHSTVFSFFVTYGLVGGLLFTSFLLLWVRRVYSNTGILGLICIVGPPIAYGLTHNGSRFTLFWMLVAISFSVGRDIRYTAPRRTWMSGSAVESAYLSR